VSEISSCTKVSVSDGILSELQARNNLDVMFALEVERRMGFLYNVKFHYSPLHEDHCGSLNWRPGTDDHVRV
jgi:hypothetical protein